MLYEATFKLDHRTSKVMQLVWSTCKCIINTPRLARVHYVSALKCKWIIKIKIPTYALTHTLNAWTYDPRMLCKLKVKLIQTNDDPKTIQVHYMSAFKGMLNAQWNYTEICIGVLHRHIKNHVYNASISKLVQSCKQVHQKFCNKLEIVRMCPTEW